MKNGYIEKKAGVLGGMPVVKGTRIPIGKIVFLLEQGYSAKQITGMYPYLSERTINGVIGTLAEEAEKGRFFSPING